MRFQQYFGIDYSGAKTADQRSATLQVYRCEQSGLPMAVKSPASNDRRQRNWTRREIAEHLCEVIESGQTVIAGIDHAFSFPIDYFRRYCLTTWSEFLTDFCQHWPTADHGVTVEDIRRSEPSRTGNSRDLRLADQWTSSAKSVFLFDVQGSVAKSTHAGIPFIKQIKDRVGDKVHFWPFDGWQVPEGQSVLSETYPSLFRKRYELSDRSPDQQDAYSVSRWLADMDRMNRLQDFFHPPLSESQLKTAKLEGWILGAL